MSLSLLKAEIELKKQKQREQGGGDASAGGKKRKWFRRGDVEQDEEDQQKSGAGVTPNEDGQREGPEELQNKEGGNEGEKKQKTEEVDGAAAEDQPKLEEDEVIFLTKDEVIRRLRAQGEPATLFGETDLDRYRRLKEFELKQADGSKGQRNVFQMKMRAMKGNDEIFLNHDEDQQQQIKPPAPADASEEDTPKTDEDYVRIQIKKLMAKWKETLDKKSAEEKRTQRGRSALASYEQSQEYLAPLMKKLKKRQLGGNVLHALKKIFQFVEQREYVQANDVYLKLAIGNAPWPMGATMVGIHARHAREKIGEGKIAHVMNDEPTRKFIQAVKRLITMAQSWNPTVPSKMISS